MSSLAERFRMSTETPQDRVRASILLTVLSSIAERILQYDKANPSYRLSDLRSDEERAIYIAAAEELLTDGHADRVIRFNVLRGHVNALAEKDQRDVEIRAGQDVIDYGAVRRGNFGAVPAGRCFLCTDPIAPEMAAVLELSATLKVEVHGECCLHDPKFEMTAQFAFRVRGGQR